MKYALLIYAPNEQVRRFIERRLGAR